MTDILLLIHCLQDELWKTAIQSR